MTKFEVAVASFNVGDFIVAPGRCLGTISSVYKKEVTILWKDNGLSAEYTFSQIEDFNYQHISKDSQFKIGDRFEIVAHKKYSGQKGYLSGYHTDDSPEFWVKLDNYDLQIRVFPNEVKFLEDDCNSKNGRFGIGDRFQSKSDKSLICTLIKIRNGGKKPYTIHWENGRKVYCDEAWLLNMKFLEDETQEAIVECLHNLTSAQELVPVSVTQDCNLDSNLLQSQRLTNTPQASSNCDTQTYTTTETCEIYQDLQNAKLGIICTQEESISLQLPHPALHSLQKANDLEVQTSVIVSPQFSKSSENCNLDSQPLKMSQDLSPAPIIQGSPRVHISEEWSEPLTNSGTMRNGWLSEAATLPAPTLEKDYCWLRSPGALSLSGKGRPPGQTKQEAQLKKLKVLSPREVVNPEFLESAYSLPLGWTDPQENRSASELLAEMGLSVIAAQPSVMPSTGELPPSHCSESNTLNPCVKLKAITLHQPWAYLVGRYKWFETRTWSTNYRGKIAIHAAQQQDDTEYWCSLLGDLLPTFEELVFGAVVAVADLTDCILMTEEFISQQSSTELRCGNWEPGRYAWKLENIQIFTEPISAKGKQGLWNIDLLIPSIECTQQSNHVSCPSCESPLIKLNDGCGVCGWIPENSSEETKPVPASQRTKQPKGCLYKYVESKKLKDGSIVSYPRVDGERDSENPSHWRWGFNWELKINGKWKGRSIGSIPADLILDIKLMQLDGASLEQIISFIKLSKTKKF